VPKQPLTEAILAPLEELEEPEEEKKEEIKYYNDDIK